MITLYIHRQIAANGPYISHVIDFLDYHSFSPFLVSARSLIILDELVYQGFAHLQFQGDIFCRSPIAMKL